MAFSFKTLEAQHAESWISLRLEGVRDFPLGFLLTEEEALRMDKTRAENILNGGSLRGVFTQENLVGFCGYRPETLERTRHRAEIGPFFVGSNYHGSGAADTLMGGVIAEARSAGIVQLELFVDTENFRAINFYERHRFEKVATHLDGVRIDGNSRDDFFYRFRVTD